MKAFVERYVLGLFVVIVGLWVFGANPLGWDLQQRVAALVALSALTFLVALFLESRRRRKTQKIRNLRNIALTLLVISCVWFGTDLALSRWNHNGAAGSQDVYHPPATVKQQTSGPNSPAVANTGGDVTINANAQPSPEKKHKKQ